MTFVFEHSGISRLGKLYKVGFYLSYNTCIFMISSSTASRHCLGIPFDPSGWFSDTQNPPIMGTEGRKVINI